MKKYLWIAALVAALAMVFVGCDGGDDTGGTEDKATISFNWNTPASYTGPSLTAPDPIKIDKGAAIGTLPPAPPGVGDFGLTFIGWFSAATGGTQVTAATTFNANAILYARWSDFDPDTEVMITFNLNYDGAPASAIIKFTLGEAAGTKWPADPTRPGNTPGKDTMNDTWAFKGWVEYENMSGDTFTSATVMPAAKIHDDTVWAKWEPSTGWRTEVPPAGTDLAGAEMVQLENAWFLPYYFELPAGKKYSDYAEITFEIMVGPETLIRSGSCRALRLMGNYVNADFELVTPNTPDIGNYPEGMMIASYNNGKNAEYILNGVSNPANTTLESAFNTLGLNATAWVWNTIHHKIDGTDAHGSFQAKNLPGADATGPFIFGVGIPGQGGGGSLEWIRNVMLVGNTGTVNVIAKPLWFSEGGKTYPAFNGYPTKSGGDGYKEAYRGMADGSTPVAVPK
jgi:hypothetical protein